MTSDSSRHHWTVSEVSDVSGPAALLRNYLEQRDLRRCLRAAGDAKPLRTAADVGCGYGRLTMVLSEFASEAVVGFEREPALLRQARSLMPGVDFRETRSLDRLRADEAAFDFVMTFTVLQHMREPDALAVIRELKRVSSGCALLVEETDPRFVDGDPATEGTGITVGREVSTYAGWMEPWPMILSFPRRIEPGYPRADVGHFMLFSKSG